jgi:hypothetical protein
LDPMFTPTNNDDLARRPRNPHSLSSCATGNPGQTFRDAEMNMHFKSKN